MAGGNDLLNGSAGNDILSGGNGNDTLNGGEHSDSLSGALGADILNGGQGGDSLNGGFGADILNGGAGGDFLTGARHADIMTGGGGGDVFIFNKADDSGILEPDRDTITDFATGVDKLDFSDLMTLLGITGAVVGAFSGISGQIILGASGIVSLDLDGDAAADMQIEVEDGGVAAALVVSDLIL